jgi:hypothetical protein
VNEPPVADAGGPYELKEGSSTELDASGSSDPDGSIVSDKTDWTVISGPGNVNGNTYAAPSSISGDATAKINIEVTDNQGETDTDTTTININPVDSGVGPTADAGGPYSIEAGESITLDGSGSSAPDSSIEQREWERIAGPGSVSGSTYNAPASVSSDTTTEIKLTITDSTGATDTDTAKINLQDFDDSLPATNGVAINQQLGVGYVIQESTIVRFDLETRDRLGSFPAPDGTNQGLAYGGGSLWYADAASSAYDGRIV